MVSTNYDSVVEEYNDILTEMDVEAGLYLAFAGTAGVGLAAWFVRVLGMPTGTGEMGTRGKLKLSLLLLVTGYTFAHFSSASYGQYSNTQRFLGGAGIATSLLGMMIAAMAAIDLVSPHVPYIGENAPADALQSVTPDGSDGVSEVQKPTAAQAAEWTDEKYRSGPAGAATPTGNYR